MPPARLRLVIPAAPSLPRQGAVAPARPPLAQILRQMGAVDPANLLKAEALCARQPAGLGTILLTRGWIGEADLMAALSRHWSVPLVDLARTPADPRLIDRLGLPACIAHAAVPLRRQGACTVIATADPDRFDAFCALLPRDTGPVVMALAPERDIHDALATMRQTRLIRQAECRVAPQDSCRTRDAARMTRWVLAGLMLLVAGLLATPRAVLAGLVAVAVLAMIGTTALKAAAFAAHWRALRAPPPPPPPVRLHPKQAVVSVMVPLFGEAGIVPALVARIGRQTYPRELLDVLLVVEATDSATRAALAQMRLPPWMRVVPVPDGPLRTKPRALNYALNFAKGSIIGVWDAEDDPDPAQVEDIVRRFDHAPADVACLQGILDYRNSDHNWLARCFTVEYAAWFQVQLAGVARLGLVVPLGGTTLFFRRAVLEALGGWDAHNVTEDADLGLRLARHGYRTELVPTVTLEEPNARPLKWIRQRSRWIKGYAMTWGVHMRDPARLWRDLGPWRFCGMQVQFLGSILQSLLAPVLWLFWLRAFGLPHPLDPVLGPSAMTGLALLFVLAEAVNIALGLWAVRGTAHRHLRPWVPTLHFYYPLAALAAWKALYEVAARPFWWDKTAHGLIAPDDAANAAPAPSPVSGLALPAE